MSLLKAFIRIGRVVAGSGDQAVNDISGGEGVMAMKRKAVWVVAAALSTSAGVTLGSPVQGASAVEEQQMAVATPQTAQEHLARAATYKEKAAQSRKEAEEHRKMFADYDKKQGSPLLKSKMGRDEPWVAKMRQHCNTYIKAAETMAAEAERFAEFHRMRAEEMQSK